ncbi:AAA domain-containing protein [Tepidibacter sp. Z1-5]|uniref:AAA domain-containing protein n=1 Tax=Tepidibacter sp. Z1-5 TaxID=3134138 RepID=UPI0030C43C14
MKEKLTLLRDNLSDLSNKNRSLRLIKLSDKWNFDLTNINKKQDNDNKVSKCEEVLQKLLKESSKIELINDKTADAQINSHKLSSLYKNITLEEKEKGTYDLYIGYPFLTGRLKNNNFIQAPIFLFPVKLCKNNGLKSGWYLEVEDNEECKINKALLLALQKYNEGIIDNQIYEEVIEFPKENLETWICEVLNKYGIECVYEDEDISCIPEYCAKNIPNINIGTLKIKRNLILGHFPQGSTSIYKDYDEIIDKISKNNEHSLLDNIFKNEENIDDEGVWDNIEKIEIDKFPEKELFNITDSDASQEEVILNLDKIKGLVLQGPPGTGKSQVITNLISNAMPRDYKVLVVCQKRAALDVVYDRLKKHNLSDQVALVHNTNEDKKDLYKKIKSLLEEKNLESIESEIENYNELCNNIQTKTAYFNKIARGLWNVQDCGLSLYKLYSESKLFSGNEKIMNFYDLPYRINKQRLDKIISLVNRLGNYHSKFGHEKYLLKNRKSFKDMNNTDLAVIMQAINKTIEEMENVFNIKDDIDLHKYFRYHKVIEAGLIKLEKYNNRRNILSKIGLWLWLLKGGKNLIKELDIGSTTQWDNIYNQLTQINNYNLKVNSINNRIKSFDRFLNNNDIKELLNFTVDKDAALETLKNLNYNLERDFNSLVEMDSLISKLDNKEKKIFDILCEENIIYDDLGNVWSDTLKKSFYTKWIDIAEKSCPEIKDISTDTYNEMLEEYKKLILRKQEVIPKYIQNKLKEKITSFKNNNLKEYKDILHEASKKKKVWSIRKLMDKYYDKGLLDIIPVWLVSPETVSAICPLINGLFDLVIFDEASQCTIENGIPSLYRGKKVIVAGDDKQLPPSNLFKASLDLDDENEEQLNEYESLLSLSEKYFSCRLLQWHYRSKYEELINFSNHAFYEGKVQIAPNVMPYADPPAIEWINANGIWENESNLKEAIKVCDILKQTLENYTDKTIKIITFNQKQQELIKRKIKEYEEDIEFKGLYQNIKSEEDFEEHLVKNIENVQGDESDIVIFSVGYGKNTQGKLSVNFGTLNRLGGENRLNVAITRAKEKIIVVCSFNPNHLQVGQSKNIGPSIFKQFLRYSYAISNKDYELAKEILKEVNPSLREQNSSQQLAFDSPFESQVYNKLVERGYDVRTQVGCSDYKIDLAIINPTDSTHFILGVECDGAMYHSAKSAKERDIYRQRFLEDRGWSISRIWSRNWWANPEREIDRIEKEIKSLLNN